jgi:hypothetical protein
LEEEWKLMVYENRVLRKILRSKRNEVTGEWMTIHNEEPWDVYSSLEGWEERGACNTYRRQNMCVKCFCGKV